MSFLAVRCYSNKVDKSRRTLTGGLLHLPTFLQSDALHIGYQSLVEQQGS